MTTPHASKRSDAVTSDAFTQERSLGSILSIGSRLYVRYWLPLNWPIVTGWLGLSIGLLLWLVLPLGGVTWMIDHNTLGINDSAFLLWGLVILSNLPGMVLFARGFWSTMVWLSALNVMIRELHETGVCQDPTACALRVTTRSIDYAVLLALLLVFQALPLVILLAVFLGLSVIVSGLGSDTESLILISAAVCLILFLFFNVLSSTFFCLAYQAFVFEPGPVAAVLLTSLQRLFQAPFKALFLVLINFILLQVLLPSLLLELSKLVGLYQPIVDITTSGILYYLSQLSPPENAQLLASLPAAKELADIVCDLAITSSLCILSLPLATCWFAYLYAHSDARRHKTSP